MLKRLFISVLSLWFITIISFTAIELSPKDISLYIGGTDISILSANAIEKINHELDFDKPAYIRYIKWLKKAVTLDFGNSMVTNKNIMNEFKQRFVPTFIIAAVSIFLAFIFSVVMGIASVSNKAIDTIIRITTTILMSLPIFLVALIILITLVFRFKFIPVFWENSIYNYILPIALVSFYNGIYLSRILRNKLFDIIHSEYFLAALGKGYTFIEAVYKHALKNSLVTLITILGLRLINLLGGLVLVESIFSIPGLGSFILESISSRDYPVIQCYILFIGCFVIIVNLALEVIIRMINPRLSKESIT
jgi:ABC-type dipeptide/oligopeptide/nickel transport system permease component